MGQFSGALRERGHRLTIQREVIIDVVEAARGHISVEGIFAAIHPRFPQINVSTVYRTLELLEEEGLLTHTHFHDGVAKWHRADEGRHQHLVCRQCGAELDLDLTLVAPLGTEIDRRFGFEADFTHFVIVGLCQECRAQAATP